VSLDADFPTYDGCLEPGSGIVLYTDGLVELDRDAPSGEARLAEVVRALCTEPADRRARSIVSTLVAGTYARDDIAIVTVFRRTS
jgi:serine phosphatase RsbU (regulator of sigma subunit)